MNNFNYFFSLVSERIPNVRVQEGIDGPYLHLHEVHSPCYYLHRINELQTIIKECRERFMASTEVYAYEPIINVGAYNKDRIVTVQLRIRH